MAPTPREVINAGVATIHNIKLEDIKKSDLTATETEDSCAFCSVSFSAPTKKRKAALTLRGSRERKPKRSVVRLLPCGHLFHRHCITEWAVCEKDFNAIPVAGEENETEIEQDDDDHSLAEDQNDPVNTDDMIELPGGWVSMDGTYQIRRETGVTCTCPLCRSHILPADDDFNFRLAWTKEEQAFAKDFFHNPEIANSAARLARSGETKRFAKDLMAARKYAQKRVREG